MNVIEYERLIENITYEITSAISSLNMPPQPLETAHKDAEFLSETDKWAAHSVEHMRKAFKLTCTADSFIRRNKDKLQLLQLDILKIPGVDHQKIDELFDKHLTLYEK